MRAKTFLRAKAVGLRKQGLSYSEILKEVPVARASISLWLHSYPLTKTQQLRFKLKAKEAQKLGAEAKRRQRIERTEKIKELAHAEINTISKKNLFLMGVMLYWAEGAKERSIGHRVSFSNSDPSMCRVFLKWCKECLKLKDDMITPRIYIHESQERKSNQALKYWSQEIGIPIDNFMRTCLTHTRPSQKRRKDSGKYYGQLRIDIRKSTDINRKITGWIEKVGYLSAIT